MFSLYVVLITNESNLDPRRAYQCMKVLVELALENSAVVDGLSHFPELWGPAVDWLRSLIETSEGGGAFTRKASFTKTGQMHDVVDSSGAGQGPGHRHRAGTFSGGNGRELIEDV